MKTVKIIIGANFGDEGKGLMTQHFVSTLDNSLVVRFNGGGQAGHTIIHNDERIVFSHFGSGTALGAPTFLAKEFICNPIVFNAEYDALLKKGIMPRVFVHKDCRLTTPYDVLMNRAIEKQRAGTKHGSCGIGIQETVRRSADYYRITVEDYFRKDFEDLLLTIPEEYLEKRAQKLGLIEIPEAVHDADIIKLYLHECDIFIRRITIVGDNNILHNYDSIIFEGAQGLLLDWDTKYFPYATPSHTGITHPLEILNEFDDCDTEVVYMTRCYLTRHGAGPMETEQKIDHINVVDQTNRPNEWQDTLRLGVLDFELLKETIDKDYSKCNFAWKMSMAVTCLDQTNTHLFKIGKESLVVEEDRLLMHISKHFNPHHLYTCHDAAGKTIQTFD